MLKELLFPVALAACVGACSSTAGSTDTTGTDGGSGGGDGSSGGGDGGSSSDGGSTNDSGTHQDGGVVPPVDGGGGWDGGFTGALTCSGTGNYTHNGSQCGIERWAIKTGTDTAANGISLVPTSTTIAALSSIAAPGTIPFSTRVAPAETTLWSLKDVKLTFARLEQDSDYHLVLTDGAATMITEIPYPGTCVNGGPWACLISRARAAVDAKITLLPLQGHNQNLVVSVIGVGFFDPEHGQFGTAPNGIELHAVLAICFGQGCDPRLQ